jgi:hypothetical protein
VECGGEVEGKWRRGVRWKAKERLRRRRVALPVVSSPVEKGAMQRSKATARYSGGEARDQPVVSLLPNGDRPSSGASRGSGSSSRGGGHGCSQTPQAPNDRAHEDVCGGGVRSGGGAASRRPGGIHPSPDLSLSVSVSLSLSPAAAISRA